MLVDTSGLLCLIHRREPQHERAVSFYDAATTRVTHNSFSVNSSRWPKLAVSPVRQLWTSANAC